MPNKGRLLYWDSDVFLSYMNAYPGRIGTLDALLEEIRDKQDDSIVTSLVAKVEVAFSYSKSSGPALHPGSEARIDALWNDSSVIRLIELNDDTAIRARSLVRKAVAKGWSLTPLDAIHLASAQWMRDVQEFHTYDKSLAKYSELIDCTICEPWVRQPRLHE